MNKGDAEHKLAELTQHMENLYCPQVEDHCLGNKCVNFNSGEVFSYPERGFSTVVGPRCRLWNN